MRREYPIASILYLFKPFSLTVSVGLALVTLFIFSTCVPVKEKNYELRKSLGDTTVAQIIVYQNNHNTRKLLPFFSHPNPTYRYFTARAFQSYTDSTVTDSLIRLLNDENMEVRTAAAYALGQFGEMVSATPLIEAFESGDSTGEYTMFNQTILEAVGKTGGRDELKLLTGISTYRPSDTSLILGQLRGLLQFKLRDLAIDKIDSIAMKICFSSLYPARLRVLAAEILSRSNSVELNEKFYTVKRLWKNSASKTVKRAYLRLMKKMEGENSRKFLRTIINTSSDMGYRATALQALTTQPYSSIKTVLDSMILSDETQLRRIAGNAILRKSKESRISEYEQLLEKARSPFAKATLYKTIIKTLPFYYAVTKLTLKNEILELMDQSENPYLTAELYGALAEDVSNYDFIIENGLSHKKAVVRTTACRGLLKILQSQNLEKQFRQKTDKVKDKIYSALESTVINEADDGSIYVIIEAAEDIDFQRLMPALKEARENLLLPESWEVYKKLSETLDLEAESRVQFIKNIDVEDVLALTDSIEIVISTSKGEITLQLFPAIAPVTVMQIVELIKNNYYDGIYFHRVVPQFVIQAGCPRGDGYGGLDYLLRTETPQIYYDEAGLLGMASAGRDTESTQWFITYRITPHLNGRYTIFGKVTDGMSVVQSIGRGDRIQGITIK